MKVWREAVDAHEKAKRYHGDPNPPAAAVIRRAITEAVAEREARIVEWLRADGSVVREVWADAIERGDYKERADG